MGCTTYQLVQDFFQQQYYQLFLLVLVTIFELWERHLFINNSGISNYFALDGFVMIG